MARITKGSPKIGLVYLVYVVFIFLGMLDSLLEGAWPTLRVDYSIPIDSPGMFLFAAVTGYATSSFLSGASVGFSSAPIFPALMSGTSQRMGVNCPANTMGMQMAAPSWEAALVPSLMDILARQFSLGVIPLCLVVVILGLFGVYRSSKK
jgi:fucose permease